ncbi:MAG: hypothetical protein WC539_04600 [Nitrospirota bacterium]
MGLFDFGKQEKKPFKVPQEIHQVRMHIEAETQERYPRLHRYQEIVFEIKSAYKALDVLASQHAYSTEIQKIKEDLGRKLDTLRKKISANKLESGYDENSYVEKNTSRLGNKQDFMERNIDYLERKSMRNNAKTLFTDFLDDSETILLFANQEKMPSEKNMESVIHHLFQTVSDLNSQFFKLFAADVEIQSLKKKTLEKIIEIDACFNEQRSFFRSRGLEPNLELQLQKYRRKEH